MSTTTRNAPLYMAPTFQERVQRAYRGTVHVLRREPTVLIGAVILLIMASMAIFGTFITRTDYTRVDPINRLIGPGVQHWFGTDTAGRDVFDRTIAGARLSLMIGFAVTLITTMIGTVVALIVGYSRLLDNVVMRFVDGLLAFPSILLALALIALMPNSGIRNVIIALSVTGTAGKIRLVRGAVLTLRETAYVDAARGMGARVPRILMVHIAPNTLNLIIVQATFTLASTILAEASLSFLGAGTPEYIPSWGNIVATGQGYVQVAFWISFFPGLFLTATVLAVVLIGDALRDYLDPKLRGRLERSTQ
ncbi:MAG: ABC transporter permease [Dehalococcoidia bacterium]|nr:ABC transporter permease [Dehalococcoidia bacterium]